MAKGGSPTGGKNIVGKIAIKVVPDTSGFKQKLEAELRKAVDSIKDLKVEVGANLNAEGLAEDARRAVREAQEAAGDIDVDMDVDPAGLVADTEEAVEEAQAAAPDIDIDLDVNRSHLSGLLRALDNVHRKTTNFARDVGRMFGSGSRNNFLHAFGNAINGLLSIIPGAIGLLRGLFRAAQAGGEAFQKASEEGMGNFNAGLRALVTAAANIIPTLIGVVAMIVVLNTVLGLAVSFVNFLVGALTVLVAALGFALLGTLLPLVPLLAAVGAGFLGLGGAIIMAVKNSKKFPHLQKDIKGLKDQFNGLVKAVAPSISKLAGTVLGGVSKAFSDANELTARSAGILGRQIDTTMGKSKTIIQRFADAIKGVVKDLDDKISSPKMAQFFQQWGVKLPQIFESFAKGLNSLVLALVAFFTPILPYAQRLADAFQRMSDKFLAWTTSAKGQNSIANFMSRAWDAAKKFWQSVKNIGVALGNILDIAQDNGGQGFLDWLQKITKKFSDWTKSTDGKNSIKDFFKDIKADAKKFAGVLSNLWDTWKQFSSKKNRKTFSDFAGSLEKMSSAVTAIAKALDGINASNLLQLAGIDWSHPVDGLKKMAKGLGKLALTTVFPVSHFIDFGKLGAALEASWPKLKKKIDDGMSKVGGWIMDGLKGGLTNAAKGIGDWVVSKIPKPIIDGVKAALGIRSPSTVFKEIGENIVAGLLQGIAGLGSKLLAKIGSELAGIPGKLKKFGKSIVNGLINGIDAAFPGLGDKIRAIPGKIKGWFKNPGKTLKSAGTSVVHGLVAALNAAIPGIGPIISRIPGKIKGWFKNPNRTLRAIGRSVISGLKSALSTALPGVGPIISGIPGKIKGWFKNPRGTLQAAGRSVISGLASAMGSAVGWVRGALRDIKGVIPASMWNAGTLLYGAGQSIISGLASGITSVWRKATGAISWVMGKVSAFIPHSPAKEGPFSGSGWTPQRGEAIVKGLAQGIISAAPAAVGATSSLMETLSSQLDTANLQDMGVSLMDSLVDGMDSRMGHVKRFMDQLSSGLEGGIGSAIAADSIVRARSIAGNGHYMTTGPTGRDVVMPSYQLVGGSIEIKGDNAYFRGKLTENGTHVYKAAQSGGKRLRKI